MNSTNLFNGLNDNQIEEFNSLCTIKRFSAKTLIIKDNSKINGVYIIKNGFCQVYSLEQDGKEFIFSQLQSGEVIGEMSCLDSKPSSANVKAITDCEIDFIEKEKFVNFFMKNPSFALNLTKIIINRLRNADHQIERLVFLNVEQRIVEFFKSITIENQGKYLIGPIVGTKEIAKSVGATREMCGRIIRSLEKRGILKFEESKMLLKIK
jgi:CRP-like cAMP-binding protein